MVTPWVCTADSSLYIPLRKFPIQLAHLNALLHLQLLPDFTKTLSSLPHEFHPLPSRSRLCPSFPSHGTSTTSTGTGNDCPFLFPDLLIYILQIPHNSLPSLTRANTQTQKLPSPLSGEFPQCFLKSPMAWGTLLKTLLQGCYEAKSDSSSWHGQLYLSCPPAPTFTPWLVCFSSLDMTVLPTDSDLLKTSTTFWFLLQDLNRVLL